ncbi:NAD(P)H-dependent oxidoreductase [Sphaerisporangium flaviroseum]|uniref:FMN dependent NADH:quinone oxidoreductase n=1 Tax=Sphaerisporangium flaviroseum TaxID=509199 RepID=A0ABP7IQG0_9ACTN
MSRLLHISASPRGAASISLNIAETFLDTYRRTHPGDTVEEYDLWDGSLPEFGPAAAGAKMTVFGGGTPAGEEAAAWDAVTATFERFDAYDRYLFSVPMWNSGVPYKLKQFMDVVSQPGMIFGVHPATGYSHLLTGKRAAVIYTSAVWGPGLGPEFGADHQSGFFTGWLRWTGITDVQEIHHHPTLTGDRDLAHKRSRERAQEVARVF